MVSHCFFSIGCLDPHVSGLPSAQDGPGGLPDRPTRAQSSSKMSQEASKIAPERPKRAHSTAITPQESLKLAHDGARRDPRRPLDSPTTVPRDPPDGEDGPKPAQESSKTAQEA